MSKFQFRAWDGKIMRYAFLVARPQFADVLMIMQDEDFAREQYNLQEWKVMQFTGLFDKGGNAIWEGDIIKYIPFNYNSDLIYVQCPTLDNFHWYSELQSMFEDFEDKCQIEVVGNIYENPELLQ